MAGKALAGVSPERWVEGIRLRCMRWNSRRSVQCRSTHRERSYEGVRTIGDGGADMFGSGAERQALEVARMADMALLPWVSACGITYLARLVDPNPACGEER